MAIQKNFNTIIPVDALEDGLSYVDVIEGRIVGVKPDAVVTAGGFDDRQDLVVVHVFIILAKGAYPMPVGLVGKLAY